jgi:RNA polymerase sigma-70 factor (ECF subfamily)
VLDDPDYEIPQAAPGDAGEDGAVLLALLRAGDQGALLHLYRRYAGRLYRYALHNLQDHAAAEDVASEALMRLMGALGRYQDRGVSLKPYLYRIAANLVADQRRRGRRLTPLSVIREDDALSVDPSELAEHRLAWHELEALLAQLTRDQRAVVVLRFAHGMTADQAATQLDKTVGAVKALQHRALAILRRALEARDGPADPPPAR